MPEQNACPCKKRSANGTGIVPRAGRITRKPSESVPSPVKKKRKQHKTPAQKAAFAPHSAPVCVNSERIRVMRSA